MEDPAVFDRSEGKGRSAKISFVAEHLHAMLPGEGRPAGDIVRLLVGLEGLDDAHPVIGREFLVELDVARRVEDRHFSPEDKAVTARGLAGSAELVQLIALAVQKNRGQQISPGLDSSLEMSQVGVPPCLQNLDHEFGRALLGAHGADTFSLGHLGNRIVFMFDKIHIRDIDHIYGLGAFNFKSRELRRVADVQEQEFLGSGHKVEQFFGGEAVHAHDCTSQVVEWNGLMRFKGRTR